MQRRRQEYQNVNAAGNAGLDAGDSGATSRQRCKLSWFFRSPKLLALRPRLHEGYGK